MRLIPWCAKLGGTTNLNQARYHCLFAVPFRRSCYIAIYSLQVVELGSGKQKVTEILIYLFGSEL